MGNAGSSAGSEGYWVSGKRGQEKWVEKRVPEDKAGERWKDRARQSWLLVGLAAGVCGCAHLATSEASATILSCEFAQVEVRGDRLGREVGTTGAAN